MENAGASCGAAGGDGVARTRGGAGEGCHTDATTQRGRLGPEPCDLARRCGSLLVGSVLAGTLTEDLGYARAYVGERGELQSTTPVGVCARRSGGDGNVRRGDRGVRLVRPDAVREPAGPAHNRRARGWSGAPR